MPIGYTSFYQGLLASLSLGQDFPCLVLPNPQVLKGWQQDWKSGNTSNRDPKARKQPTTTVNCKTVAVNLSTEYKYLFHNTTIHCGCPPSPIRRQPPSSDSYKTIGDYRLHQDLFVQLMSTAYDFPPHIRTTHPLPPPAPPPPPFHLHSTSGARWGFCAVVQANFYLCFDELDNCPLVSDGQDTTGAVT